VFFGNGSSKCKQVISHPNTIFIDNIHPLSCNAAPLAEQRLRRGETASTAYFEPFYLKEFQATKPKNLL
jgi:tRNA threonylcarbamoyladenosine biosynthesis protein TsaB